MLKKYYCLSSPQLHGTFLSLILKDFQFNLRAHFRILNTILTIPYICHLSMRQKNAFLMTLINICGLVSKHFLVLHSYNL